MTEPRKRMFNARMIPALSFVAVVAAFVATGGERTAIAGNMDGGGDGGGGGMVDGSTVDGGGSCPVAITATDIAEVNPPKSGTQGSCTDAELSKITGMFSDILANVSAKCASCIFTESTDTTNTQFFVWADSMHMNVSLENFGACMGSPLSGGNAACGKAAEEIESCLEAACPRDSMGNTTCTDITDQDCITAATAGDCKQYDDKQTSDCGGASALKAVFAACFDSMGGPDPGIKLLCGGAAVAGGDNEGGLGGGGDPSGSDGGNNASLGDDQVQDKSGCNTNGSNSPIEGGLIFAVSAIALAFTRKRR